MEEHKIYDKNVYKNNLRELNGKITMPLFRVIKPDKFHRIKLKYILTRKDIFSRIRNVLYWLYDRHRSIYINSHPLFITFEANSTCNLKCPNCVTGTGMPIGNRGIKAELSTMKTLIDIVYKHSFQFAFHNNGEPYLNDDVHNGVHYADSKGLWTCIHSNFSHDKKGFIDNILESNLKNLVISCDGATKEIYNKYRVNGDLDLVFRNIVELVRKKKKHKSLFPWITAKFHVFDHNWHEMKLFKKRALEVGVNDVLFLRAFSNGIYKTGRCGTEKEFSLNELKWKNIKLEKICPHVWSEELHIDYDGGIMPCGRGHHDSHIVVPASDIRYKTLKEKLNHESFISLRKFFLHGLVNVNELPFLCRDCEYTSN